MQRFKCTIEYDGTGLAGWQRQPDRPSVQEHIEYAIYQFCDETVNVFTAGRTDAGVHAKGQVAHFDIEKKVTKQKVMGALNFYLKEHSIAILNIETVDENFHARFSATRRHYIYKILNRRGPAALDKKRVWVVHKKLNIKAMQEAGKVLIGKHDFTSFRDSECQSKSPVKTLEKIEITQHGDEIHFSVSAPSFLHHMVRNIVGTLKYVGEGKWTKNDIKKILDAKDRKKAGPTAPPQGLYLVKVDY